MEIEHLFYAALCGALLPMLTNIFAGFILTIKNKYSDTPKFDIGAVFDWSQLPASGSIFPKSIMVNKSSTHCHFLDITENKVNGRYSMPKRRWMISSAALLGICTQEQVDELVEIYKRQRAEFKLEIK